MSHENLGFLIICVCAFWNGWVLSNYRTAGSLITAATVPSAIVFGSRLLFGG